MQKEPSREDRVFDLVCTVKPSLVKCVSTTPGISNHLAVVCDSDIGPAHQKKAVYMFSKANWGKMTEAAKLFAPSFISQIDQFTVDENWTKFKDHITSSVKSHVPSKIASRRQHLPCVTPELKRKTRGCTDELGGGAPLREWPNISDYKDRLPGILRGQNPPS